MIVSQYASIPLRVVVRNFNDAVQERDECQKRVYWALSLPAALISMLSLVDVLLLAIPYECSVIYRSLCVESFYNNNEDNVVEENFKSSLSTFLGSLNAICLATMSLTSNERI